MNLLSRIRPKHANQSTDAPDGTSVSLQYHVVMDWRVYYPAGPYIFMWHWMRTILRPGPTTIHFCRGPWSYFPVYIFRVHLSFWYKCYLTPYWWRAKRCPFCCSRSHVSHYVILHAHIDIVNSLCASSQYKRWHQVAKHNLCVFAAVCLLVGN